MPGEGEFAFRVLLVFQDQMSDVPGKAMKIGKPVLDNDRKPRRISRAIAFFSCWMGGNN